MTEFYSLDPFDPYSPFKFLIFYYSSIIMSETDKCYFEIFWISIEISLVVSRISNLLWTPWVIRWAWHINMNETFIAICIEFNC